MGARVRGMRRDCAAAACDPHLAAVARSDQRRLRDRTSGGCACHATAVLALAGGRARRGGEQDRGLPHFAAERAGQCGGARCLRPQSLLFFRDTRKTLNRAELPMRV
eukprot:6188744-Pleurochrysis_carterae.AAC.1